MSIVTTLMALGIIAQAITMRLMSKEIDALEEEIEAIKSWYPFCEIMKIDLEKLRKEVDDGKTDRRRCSHRSTEHKS